MEIAWRLEDARALAPRNHSALLETICALRQRLVVRGGSSRFIWCPAHVGIYGNLAADAVAKAFLYGPVTEPRLRVRRSIHIPTMWSAGDDESCRGHLSERPGWPSGAPISRGSTVSMIAFGGRRGPHRSGSRCRGRPIERREAGLEGCLWPNAASQGRPPDGSGG